MNRLGVFLFPTVCLAMVSPAVASPRPLTVPEARLLVREAMRSQNPRFDRVLGIEMDPSPDPFFPGYMTFNVGTAAATEEGFTYDYVDVNMRNADVMEAMMCEGFAGKRLASLQRRLRHKMGLSPSDAFRFRLKRPYC